MQIHIHMTLICVSWLVRWSMPFSGIFSLAKVFKCLILQLYRNYCLCVCPFVLGVAQSEFSRMSCLKWLFYHRLILVLGLCAIWKQHIPSQTGYRKHWYKERESIVDRRIVISREQTGHVNLCRVSYIYLFILLLVNITTLIPQ